MTSVSKRKLIIKKNWKKLNRKVKLTTSDNLIKFHNTATNDVWQFQKVDEQIASNARVSGYQVKFGAPRIKQTVYPGQTIRIPLGWKACQIPATSLMQIYPDPALLSSDVVAVAQVVDDQLNATGQITQTILNVSDHPIKFDIRDQNPVVYQFNEQTGQLIGDFDWANFANIALGIAAKLIPFFL